MVAPFSAKMRFRPKGGIAFLPPDFSSGDKNYSNYSLIGFEWKFFKLRKKPLFSINPLRNKFWKVKKIYLKNISKEVIGMKKYHP